MKLFYREFGEGKSLIILHGILGFSDNWVTFGRRLGEQYKVYIPDQRNHGQSPHSSTFNYYAMVDDLFEFIDDHEIGSAFLIGHSMGGKVAMNFALEYPDRIEKVIIVDIGIKKYIGRQQHTDILQTMLSIDFDKIQSREGVEKAISVGIKSNRIRQIILKNIYRIGKNRLAWRINTENIYHNLENVFEGIDTNFTFDKPVLFIRGGKSDYIQDEDIPDILKIFPSAEFLSVENAGHWIHADAPDELCALFSQFLGKECIFQTNS